MRPDLLPHIGAPPGQRSGPQNPKILRTALKGNQPTLRNVTDTNGHTIAQPRSESCHRCRWFGLVFPDGGRRCWTHAADADVRLVDELDELAAAVDIGLPRRGPRDWADVFAWPYGPNVDVAARGRLIAWAAERRLRLADRHWCVSWLRAGRCDCGHACPPAWSDHPSCWTRDGAPALLLSQPYQLHAEDLAQLAALDAEPGLRVQLHAEGAWYGNGTWAVEVWRAER